MVMSGKSQAKTKAPTVKTISPTTPSNARLGKDVTSTGGCGASESEADGGCCDKVAYLANDFQVSITLSGLSEIEVIP